LLLFWEAVQLSTDLIPLPDPLIGKFHWITAFNRAVVNGAKITITTSPHSVGGCFWKELYKNNSRFFFGTFFLSFQQLENSNQLKKMDKIREVI